MAWRIQSAVGWTRMPGSPSVTQRLGAWARSLRGARGGSNAHHPDAPGEGRARPGLGETQRRPDLDPGAEGRGPAARTAAERADGGNHRCLVSRHRERRLAAEQPGPVRVPRLPPTALPAGALPDALRAVATRAPGGGGVLYRGGLAFPITNVDRDRARSSRPSGTCG